MVCGAAFYTAFSLKESQPRYFVVLIIAGLLFNPILPIALPKPLWIPIDLGGAILFFRLANTLKKQDDQTGGPDDEDLRAGRALWHLS